MNTKEAGAPQRRTSVASRLSVAVVGAGPAGLYTTDFLLKQTQHPGVEYHVDIFERLVAPYGLVRSGVAPDHQGIKKVIKAFERTLGHERVRYFGNVEVGRDVKHAELLEHYDQVAYTFGAATDRRLGVDGEDLPGSHAATEFVGWYNGHPDFVGQRFDLSCTTAIVVGLGNVAMDVTRILARRPEELADSDISESALEALRHSRIAEIVLLGRRGPAQAAFSPREIRDIDELDGVELTLNSETLGDIDKAQLNGDALRNVEFLEEVAARSGSSVQPRCRVKLRFLASPAAILGGDKVESMDVEANALVNEAGRQSARGTGQMERIKAGLVLRSIGYRGVSLPDVPFDAKAGVIPNKHGRVLAPEGKPLARIYTAGWVKRGPTGLIGTNKSDAKDTVDQMLAETVQLADAAILRDPTQIDALLRKRGVRCLSFSDWQTLDAYEVQRGRERGKVREKVVEASEALRVLSHR